MEYYSPSPPGQWSEEPILLPEASTAAFDSGAVILWSAALGQTVTRGTLLAYIGTLEIRSHADGILSGRRHSLDASGDPIAQVRVCLHPLDFRGLCVQCGRDVSGIPRQTRTVGGKHRLNLTERSMRELTERNSAALCRERKLLLVLDLDHTVIHATVDSKVKNLVHKDAFRDSLFEIKLPGSGNAGSQSHFVKLRPYAREFIKSLNEFFQIQVFTWGLRHYAEQVVRILDPEDEIIKSRIVSRDDVFDPSDPSGHRELQQKELSRLFPCDEKMAIIIDDDPRVWSKVPRNLMRIPKYEFFPSAGEYAHGRATHISSRSQNSESDIFQDENWFKSRDQDNILQSFESVLKAVHKTFFHALDSNSSIRADGDASDVRFILELLRDQVLQDCSIMFSSIIPKEVPWNKSAEVTLARSYGAELYEDFPRFQSEKITHLVCGKKNTDKYHKALQLYPDIKIVKLEWLWGSAFHFKRMEEHLFDLDRKESIPWKICHDPVSTEELFASISHVLQRSDSEYSGYSASFSSDMTAIFRAKRQKTDSSEKNFILEEKSVSTVPAEVSSNDQDGVLEEISNASTSESLSTDEDGFAEAMGADLEAFLDNLP